MKKNLLPPQRRKMLAWARSIERWMMVRAVGCRLLAYAATCCAAISFVAPVASLGQGRGAADEGLELIDPNVLRVCADPNNLPFSNENGEGFENKLAELFAAKLGKKLAYTVLSPGNRLRAYGFVLCTISSPCGYPMMRSQRCEPSVIRTKPVAWG